MSDNKFSGEDFRRRREAADLTLVGLAVAVGLPSEFLSKVEKGTVALSPEAEARLEAILRKAEAETES